MLNKVR